MGTFSKGEKRREEKEGKERKREKKGEKGKKEDKKTKGQKKEVWKAKKDHFAVTILGNFLNRAWEAFKIDGTTTPPSPTPTDLQERQD